MPLGALTSGPRLLVLLLVVIGQVEPLVCGLVHGESRACAETSDHPRDGAPEREAPEDDASHCLEHGSRLLAGAAPTLPQPAVAHLDPEDAEASAKGAVDRRPRGSGEPPPRRGDPQRAGVVLLI